MFIDIDYYYIIRPGLTINGSFKIAMMSLQIALNEDESKVNFQGAFWDFVDEI
jgi:hypothetical protein